MENLKDIQENAALIQDKIERKLYCIKAYNFKMNEEFEKTFGFKFDVQKCKNDVIVILEKNIYLILQKARIIDFIIEGNSNKRFIYSCDYLEKIINILNIQYYSTKNDKLDNSLESEISKNEIYEIFDNENILTIYKIVFNDNKIYEIFENRYSNNIEKISDISLNSGFYYPENSNDEFNLDIFSEYFKKLRKFIWDDERNILYLIGPKGTSKSIFLMNFCFLCNISKNPTLYINYSKLKNLSEKQRKYIFKKEMVYLFFDFDKFKEFYKRKYHRLINKSEDNFIRNLKDFIQQLINIYSNTFNKQIILTIDNFDENNESLFSEMEQLINLVKKNKRKIKLIISGNSDFLKKKFELFVIRKSFTDIVERQSLLLYDLTIIMKLNL